MTRHARTAVVTLLLAACTGHPVPAVLDADGTPRQPTAVADGAVHVLVFTSHECPIANAYAPTLQQLAASWRGAPVQLFVVHVDPDLTAAAAKEHAAAYALPGTIVLDPTHVLARALGVTRTPEAVVLTPAGTAYRGRIDDQWRALGARSPAATTSDLADAVQAARAGRAVPAPHPPAIGCLLPEPRRP